MKWMGALAALLLASVVQANQYCDCDGEQTKTKCPVCAKTDLVNLHYVFGEQLGQYSGRIKQTPELDEMAHEFGEFKVVVVEVCLECHWNHMILSYLLGDGVKRKPPRRQQTVEDIYG